MTNTRRKGFWVRATLALALVTAFVPSHALAGGGEITFTLRVRGTNEPPYLVDAWAYRQTGTSWALEAKSHTPTSSIGPLPAGEYIVPLLSCYYLNEYVSRCALRPKDAMVFSVADSETVDIGTVYVTPSRTRAGGDDRYGTAVASSRLFFDPGIEAVVIASGEEFPDGLAASGLAGALRAPVLLSRNASIDDAVLAEIDRLGAERVYVVGGPAAVGADVLSAIESRPSVNEVVRVSGQDRYETAAAVATQMQLLLADDFPAKAFLVRGDLFPDAVSVSPYAFSQHIPVLLTPPGALAPASASALVDLEVSEVFVAGSTAAVSGEVAQTVTGLGDGIAVRRLAGSNRYRTAFRVADYAIERGWAGPNVDPALYVAFTTGENFPDALAAGPACGIREGVMLLTRPTGYRDDEEEQFIADHHEVLGSPGREGFIVMGQVDAVPQEVVNDFWLTRNALYGRPGP